MQAFPNDTISQLTDRLGSKDGRAPEAVLDNFDIVIFHVGTKDIGNRTPFQAILSDFGNLVAVCKRKKPSIKIIISAIIPRPHDNIETESLIKDVNTYLMKVMSKKQNFEFVRTYRPFMYCGKIRLELFDKKDGLNLNLEGQHKIRHFFLKVISTLKDLEMPPTWVYQGNLKVFQGQ